MIFVQKYFVTVGERYLTSDLIVLRLSSHVLQLPGVRGEVHGAGGETGEPPDGDLVTVLVEESVQSAGLGGQLCLTEVTDQPVLPH